MDDLDVTPELTIPASELGVRFARSGGPGGQHVNTASTKVEVRWNIVESDALSEPQRQLLLRQLAVHLDRDGALRVVASDTRSQAGNRELALERLRSVVARALKPPKPRRPTSPSAGNREERLVEKRHRSERKALRRMPMDPDDMD